MLLVFWARKIQLFVAQSFVLEMEGANDEQRRWARDTSFHI